MQKIDKSMQIKESKLIPTKYFCANNNKSNQYNEIFRKNTICSDSLSQSRLHYFGFETFLAVYVHKMHILQRLSFLKTTAKHKIVNKYTFFRLKEL